MKRFLSIIILIIMVFSVFACSGNVTDTKKWVGIYEIDYYSYMEADQEYLGIDYDAMTDEEKGELIAQLKEDGIYARWEFKEDYTFIYTLGIGKDAETIEGIIHKLEDDRQFELEAYGEEERAWIQFSEDYEYFEINLIDDIIVRFNKI